MNVLGTRNAASFGSEPDIKAWPTGSPLNPARVPPEHAGSPELDDALARLQAQRGPGAGPAGRAGRADLARRRRIALNWRGGLRGAARVR